MGHMIKLVLSPVLFCLIGCAGARPAPEAAAAPPVPATEGGPSEPRLWVKAAKLPGWTQAPNARPGTFLLLNGELSAQLEVSTFTSQQGEPRDAVGWLMVSLNANGAEIVEMTGDPGASVARLSFRAVPDGRQIGGRAAAKWSSVGGIGCLVIGLWPADSEALVLPTFERLFDSVDIASD